MNNNTGAMILDGVSSGMTLQQSPSASNKTQIELALVDYDNQVMVLLESSQIAIVAQQANTRLLGTSIASTSKGRAIFDDIGFISEPGARNIEFKAVSKEINTEKISRLDIPISNNITVSFRYCMPGEIIESGVKCVECSAGTFSLEWNSTECQS